MFQKKRKISHTSALCATNASLVQVFSSNIQSFIRETRGLSSNVRLVIRCLGLEAILEIMYGSTQVGLNYHHYSSPSLFIIIHYHHYVFKYFHCGHHAPPFVNIKLIFNYFFCLNWDKLNEDEKPACPDLNVFLFPGERPFKCHICARAFKQSSDLKKHINLHTGANQFKCEECNMEFRRGDALRKHKLGHQTNEKFSCSYCGIQFDHYAALQKHQAVHNGKHHVV